MQSIKPPDNIIVSDDSTEESLKLSTSGEFPDVTFLTGPKQGVGRNRNHILSAVKSDFIAFLDDDALLDKHFISNATSLIEAHGTDRDKTIWTGIELNNGREVAPNDQSFLGFQKRRYRAGDPLRTMVINSAIIPTVLAKTIGFDDRLIYGYEEVDFTTRATAAGAIIRFSRCLMNHHHPSGVNRLYYKPHINVGRIYVTFKRYCASDRNPPKALAFLFLASLHLLAGDLRRFGWKGPWYSFSSLRRSYQFIYEILPEVRHACRRARPQLSTAQGPREVPRSHTPADKAG
jgi:GT2 family glycosyltransferase